jgi:hypothetical protein
MGFEPTTPTLASEKLRRQRIRLEFDEKPCSTRECAFFRDSLNWRLVNRTELQCPAVNYNETTRQ